MGEAIMVADDEDNIRFILKEYFESKRKHENNNYIELPPLSYILYPVKIL
jgi:hypothetical protein